MFFCLFVNFQVVSILIGVLFGWLTKIIHMNSSLHKHLHLELGAFFLFSFIPYVLAEMLGFSGVMAILFTVNFTIMFLFFSLSFQAKFSPPSLPLLPRKSAQSSGMM
jgi:NhaP-type Na+/H+ or K+/H+ antiporter